jgi:mitotic spindle assembly checkpoint protein MAD1
VRQLESTSRKQATELEQLRPLAAKAGINVEKIHTLETQLSLMEDLRKHSTEMEIEVNLLRKEKSAWNTFLESNEGNHRPEQISKDLHRERTAHKLAQERIQAQDLELQELRPRVRTLESTADSLESQIQLKHEAMLKLERRLERVDRQRNLAQREVQFLKEQLKTYDSEETMFFNGAGSVIDTQKQARIEGLEKVLEEYKSEIDRLNKKDPLLDPRNDNGKRTRHENIEDEECKRKVRVLQNGTLLPTLDVNDRSYEISPSGRITTNRDHSSKISTRVIGESSETLPNKSARTQGQSNLSSPSNSKETSGSTHLRKRRTPPTNPRKRDRCPKRNNRTHER